VNPGQRRFIAKTLGFLGWGAEVLFLSGLVLAAAFGSLAEVVVVLFLTSPLLLAGLLLLWVRRNMRLGGTDDSEEG